MSSRFEIYKNSLTNAGSDLDELKKLYSSNSRFYSEMDFDEFIKYSGENASKSYDNTVLDYINKPLAKDPVKDNRNYYKDLFVMTEQEKDVELEQLAAKKEVDAEQRGYKSTRRAVVSPWSETTAAILNTGVKAVKAVAPGPSAIQILSGEESIVDNLLPSEKTVNRKVDSFFRNYIGGTDIYETKIDSETGEEYYELEEATTTAEAFARPIGELVAAMAITKKPAKKGLESIKDVFKAPTRKRGGQSKLQKKLEARQGKVTRGIDKYDPIIRAEIAGQFTFADDPDFAIVASNISEFIGDDRGKLSDLFNYLDTDEDSPEAARRLSLLLDGVVFTGAFGVAGLVGSKLVSGVTNVVNKVKAEGPEAVKEFKKIVNTIRRQDTASKKIEPVVPKTDVPLVTPLKNQAPDSFLNKRWMGLQNFYNGLKGRGGAFTPEMLNIIKSSEYNSIAWSDRAAHLHANLILTMKKASKDNNISSQDMEDMLGSYLTKEKDSKGRLITPFKSLPENVQVYAKEARDTIDSLSYMLKNDKNIPKELRKEIDENMGKYLRKTYDAFENPSYMPSQQLVDDAVATIKEGLIFADKTAGRVRPRPAGYYDQQARLSVDKLLGKNFNNKDFKSHVNAVFGSKKADVMFQKRKKLTPAIEALLGGKVDATTSVFRTIETLSHQVNSYRLYDELYNTGKGKWFFTGKGKYSVAPDDRLKQGVIKGKQFGKLNGVETTPQIAKLFDNMKDSPKVEGFLAWYGKLLSIKGFTQASATVYNFTTHARNTIGGALILARNGINPFTSDTKDSMDILVNKIITGTKSQDKELIELYREYQKLGLVNQNVRVGEFKKLFNDYADVQKSKESYNISTASTLIGNHARRTNKLVTNIYVAEDDLWRIVGYNKELRVLKEANKLSPPASRKTEAVLKQEAADIIRDTMPTYDLIAPSIQQLRKAPFGNFFSFTAEQYRNNYNTMMRGMNEIRSGNEVLVQRGMQRLASQIAVTYGMGKGATDFSKKYFGITDEDERAIRNLDLPPWSKSSALVFNRDENGNIEYVDLTYTDPTAPVTDVFRAFLNEALDTSKPSEYVGQKLLKGIVESSILFFKPFVGPAILTDKVLDLAFGGRDYDTGQPIKGFNSLEGLSIGNIMASIEHIGQDIIPKEIREDYSLIAGKKRQKIKEGEISFGDEMFAKFTGQRTTVLRPAKIKKDLSFKLFELQNALEKSEQSFNQYLRTGQTPDNFLKEYQRANRAYYKKFVNAKLALEGAKHFDVGITDITNSISRNLKGLDSREKSAFFNSTNTFTPLKLSEGQLKNFKRNGDFSDMSFFEFRTEYINLYLDYHQLPIVVDVNDEYREYKTSELVREKRFDGGIIESKKLETLSKDFPVTDVEEDPRNRVDPITKQPYSSQMEKLKLNVFQEK